MNQEVQTLIVTVCSTAAVLFINKYFELRSAAQAREQDRLDRKAAEELRLRELQEVKEKGAEREARIVHEIKDMKEIATTALKEANGTNAKIEKLGLAHRAQDK